MQHGISLLSRPKCFNKFTAKPSSGNSFYCGYQRSNIQTKRKGQFCFALTPFGLVSLCTAARSPFLYTGYCFLCMLAFFQKEIFDCSLKCNNSYSRTPLRCSPYCSFALSYSFSPKLHISLVAAASKRTNL